MPYGLQNQEETSEAIRIVDVTPLEFLTNQYGNSMKAMVHGEGWGTYPVYINNVPDSLKGEMSTDVMYRIKVYRGKLKPGRSPNQHFNYFWNFGELYGVSPAPDAPADDEEEQPPHTADAYDDENAPKLAPDMYPGEDRPFPKPRSEPMKLSLIHI